MLDRNVKLTLSGAGSTLIVRYLKLGRAGTNKQTKLSQKGDLINQSDIAREMGIVFAISDTLLVCFFAKSFSFYVYDNYCYFAKLTVEKITYS